MTVKVPAQSSPPSSTTTVTSYPFSRSCLLLRARQTCTTQKGCRLNLNKYKFRILILTSTNASSPIPSMRLTNPTLADSLQQAINSYSVTKAPNPDDPLSLPSN
mmetsp:Transcript_13042/g.21441  ORF Transcript_13042/g.21441 Transcript_13042/m.21441 type:complete len:104 (-) Transcript_13042:1129-1440(-)